jgi:hypothetical protein
LRAWNKSHKRQPVAVGFGRIARHRATRRDPDEAMRAAEFG